MDLDKNSAGDESARSADDPAAVSADSSGVKIEERPRRSVVTDAKGRTGAEIRFELSKRLEEVSEQSAVDSESEADDPKALDPSAGTKDTSGRPRPESDRGTDEPGPHETDDPETQEARNSPSDASGSPQSATVTEIADRTGTESRSQDHERVEDADNQSPSTSIDSGTDREHSAADRADVAKSLATSAEPRTPDAVDTPRPDQNHTDQNVSTEAEGGPSADDTLTVSADARHGRMTTAADAEPRIEDPIPTEMGQPRMPLQEEAAERGNQETSETTTPELLDVNTSRERANHDHVVGDLGATTDYDADASPTVNERYLVRDTERTIPLFDGPPQREQSNQGTVGDCGIVATLGAIAGHRPDAITNCIRQTGDGSFEITLHNVDRATQVDPVVRPNGDTTTYHLNDKLPVRTDESARPLAGIQADRSGWAAILEKVVAAQDQTWSQAERSGWQSEWVHYLKGDIDADRNDLQLPPSPDASPTGYDRLNLGSTVSERTNLLAEITGEAAETRRIPDEQAGAQALLDELRSKLSEGKPIVLGSREQRGNEIAPYPPDVFSFSHVYEVIDVTTDKIQLRNPWGVDEFGRSSNPPPLDADSFWELFRRYESDGSRVGYYSTLE
ncbi:hypothetical protein [Microlunatus sp. GCM10028923]|uniref:hypothetical protein n=1 Tax=Microlunatus sp. GCM10028923 TaxID=3273400 RepID=UPI00360C23FB